jgi:hypothetical protein
MRQRNYRSKLPTEGQRPTVGNLRGQNVASYRRPRMLNRSLPTDLIDSLQQSPFWASLVADRSLSPEVRDGHLTVYYRGGALLQALRLEAGALVAEVHPKYVPVAASADPVRLVETAAGLSFASRPEAWPLGHAEPDVLSAYKERMAQVLLTFPEGEVIQSIVGRAENQVLDQEIAFQAPGEKRDKIDICHYDTAIRKIVFVEVKRVDDARLFKPEGRPEVLDQLAAYGRRIVGNRSELLCHRALKKMASPAHLVSQRLSPHFPQDF